MWDEQAFPVQVNCRQLINAYSQNEAEVLAQLSHDCVFVKTTIKNGQRFALNVNVIGTFPLEKGRDGESSHPTLP